MRLHWILGLALSAVVYAQLDVLIKELPGCALTCITTSLPVSNCSIVDLDCICASQPLWHASQKCVEKECTVREALTASKVAAKGCDRPVRNRGLAVAVVGPALCFTSMLFVLARLTVRRPWPFANGLFGWDDAFIVAAWLATIPCSVFDGLYYIYGIGQDIWEVPFDHISLLLKYYWAGEMTYLASTVLVKISLLFFFLRIFPNYHFRMLCKVMIGVCVGFGIGFFFALTFQCSPVDYAWLRWDAEHSGGSCINVYVGGFMHAALNMALDIIILLMPMPLLYKLQFGYSTRQKVHAFVMFSFGLIATIISILRLQSLLKFGNTQNPSWDYWAAALWSPAEMHACIICACLPATKVAISKVLPGWVTTVISSNGGRGSRGARAGGNRASVQGPVVVPASGKQSSATSSDPSTRNSRIKSGGGPFVSIATMGRNNEDSSGFTELVDLEESRSRTGIAL